MLSFTHAIISHTHRQTQRCLTFAESTPVTTLTRGRDVLRRIEHAGNSHTNIYWTHSQCLLSPCYHSFTGQISGEHGKTSIKDPVTSQMCREIQPALEY